MPDGALKPGEYAQGDVQASLRVDGTLEVPASALIFRRQGLQVATVLPNNRVLMKSVTIACDLGTKVEIGTGLSRRDRVVDNPPDSIASGDLVRVAKADKIGNADVGEAPAE